MNIDIAHEKFVDLKIIDGNTTTNGLYPDLIRYLNEILVEIPNEKDKEMILQNISNYYNSLNTLLIKHTLEHPRMSQS